MRDLRCVHVWMLVLLATCANAQDSSISSSHDGPSEYPKAISFFAPLFFPKVLQDEFRLKEYICSEEFSLVRQSRGDVKAVDAIFNRALALSWGNVYEALLLSFVCTVEHRNFGVKLPILGSLLWVPLTSEFPGEFHQRVRALPSQLYADSPAGVDGDRDKLQHFFGSAFLTYTFESRDVASRFGMFVEWGEDKFVVEGALDQRDIRANVQGQDFGLRLLAGDEVRPSEFLGRPYRTRVGKDESGGGPESQDSIRTILEER